MKKKILFICTHNSARSQIAEGYMNAKYGDRYEAFSGGSEVTRVHPIAIAVMQEIGIDISGHRSKHIDEFFGKGIESAVTVCDSAKQACPFFPGVKEEIHKIFPDPSAFTGTDEEVRVGFRHVRDEIIQWIDATYGNNLAPLKAESSDPVKASISPDQNILVELTDAVWEKTIEHGTQPVAVMFYSPSCPFCKPIEPYFVNYAKEFHDEVVFGRVNVLTNLPITELYGVRQTPTFKFFCGGKPVLEMVGAIYPVILRKMIEVIQAHGNECALHSTPIDFEALVREKGIKKGV